MNNDDEITEVDLVSYDDADTLSDRELLLMLHADMQAIKELLAQAVEGIAPVLGDAKVKLMLGALKGFFR